MFKNFIVPCAVLLVLSCGGTKNPCLSKTCDSPLICDSDDGVCKCGGRGGVVCPSGFVCDSAANTCQSTRCKGVDCSAISGTSCDVVTGTCKCGGTGGSECQATETCNPQSKTCEPAATCNEVACPKNQTCDMGTGRCLCGANQCMPAQFCSLSGATSSDKACVSDICSGVKCAGTTVCDIADGYCKCNGLICQSGEACACPAGADGGCDGTQRTCKPGSACLGVSCLGGTTCDPVDGVCKCGGPGGPACSDSQICALGPPPQCQGGQQCSLPDGGAKTCAGGTSCDPEDGKCKCGGRGGQVCAPGATDGGDPAEVCIQNPAQQACKRPCDVRAPGDCPVAGTFCYFDSSAATPASYCAVATDTKGPEAACTVATACFAVVPPSTTANSLHCNGLAVGQTGICRSYCDTAQGMGGCPQAPRAQLCLQINGAPTGYGYCQPQ